MHSINLNNLKEDILLAEHSDKRGNLIKFYASSTLKNILFSSTCQY